MQYIDDLIARDQGSSRLYALQGKHYKMIAVSDTSGNIVERYSYTPYGEAFMYDASFNPRTSSSYDWVYLYTGRRMDDETGLYYYRNRYYHSYLGRFCSRDPIGYKGSPWNLYEYVDGQPLHLLDPYGLGIIRDQIFGKRCRRLAKAAYDTCVRECVARTNRGLVECEMICSPFGIAFLASCLEAQCFPIPAPFGPIF